MNIHLCAELQKIIEGQEYKKKSKRRKIEQTIYKYLSRMTFRPVPFGFFSSVGVIELSESDHFHNLQYERRIDLNNNVFRVLQNDQAKLQRSTLISVNKTAFVHNGKIRFYIYDIDDGNLTLRNMLADEGILDLYRWIKGQDRIEYFKIADYLISNFELSEKDANALIQHLVYNGLLITLHIPWSENGNSYYDRLRSGHHLAQSDILYIDSVISLVSRLSEPSSEIADAITKARDTVAGETNLDGSRLLKGQVNIIEGHCTIERRGVEELKTNLNKILMLTEVELVDLSQFKREVIQHDNFTGRLIDIIHKFDNPDSVEVVSQIIEQKLKQSTQNDEILIDDITPDKSHLEHFNNNICILAKKTSSGFYFRKFINDSNEGFLNKYSLLNDDIQKIIDFDACEREDIIYVEISILPIAAAYNIVNVNSSCKYTLFFENIGAKENMSIEDIGITLFNGDLVLFSFKHRKRIVPKFSNIISPHLYKNDKLLSFLFHLARNYNPKIDFISWKTLFNRGIYFKEDYYLIPRLKFAHYIVSPKTWIFESLESFDNAVKKDALPHEFLIIDKDGDELIIRQDIKCAIDILKTELKKGKIVLQEIVLGTDSIPMEHELLLPFNRPEKLQVNLSDLIEREISTSSFKYSSANEWKYFKIYCAKDETDLTLDRIKSFLSENATKLQIEKYFFIRYDDGNYHIRLRVFSRFDTGVIKNMLATAVCYKRISDGVYLREGRRYFYHDIEHVEDIFSIDSRYALQLISLKGEIDADYILLKSTMALLKSFGELNEEVLAKFISIFEQVFPHVQQQQYLNVRIDSVCEKWESELNDILHQRSIDLENIWISANYNVRATYIRYIWNFIHLHVNRISNSPLFDEIKLYRTILETF